MSSSHPSHMTMPLPSSRPLSRSSIENFFNARTVAAPFGPEPTGTTSIAGSQPSEMAAWTTAHERRRGDDENSRTTAAAALPRAVGDAPVRLWPPVCCGPYQAQAGTDNRPARGDRHLHGKSDQHPCEADSSNGIDGGRPAGGVRIAGPVALDHTR